jgi:hypothetical protein
MRLGISIAALGILACRTADPPARYVTSESCAGCHPAESARWRESHHAQAMAPPETALAPFAGESFEKSTFVREGDALFVAIDGEKFRVRATFGFEPLQQYLVELEGGRLQAYPLAWDVQQKKWFRTDNGDFHWKSRYFTWNTMCAECHSTNVEKNYDPRRDTFATTSSELAVGCESCHGPGSRHAADPRVALNNKESCAPCHARRSTLVEHASPGAAFLDQYRPMTLDPALYFVDGQIKDEVFEHGSFAQSVMHQRGVTCTDCHDPHSGKTATGNATCTSCHNATPPLERFPGLASRPRVDGPEHHRHPGEISCADCHMPERTYLQIDRRRDHSFRIPRPDLSLKLGTPNACTGTCHLDQDAAWADAKLREWFPNNKHRGPHYGEILANNEPGALKRLSLDTNTPAIVRVTALERLPCEQVDPQLLRDPDALIRSTALLCTEDPRALLDDPVRLVRIEAARVLASTHPRARKELDEALRVELDRPEGWFNRGVFAESEKRLDDARRDYARALALDPHYRPARVRSEQLNP